jgi:hypothetical protein
MSKKETLEYLYRAVTKLSRQPREDNFRIETSNSIFSVCSTVFDRFFRTKKEAVENNGLWNVSILI